jgi:hypothetical protein
MRIGKNPTKLNDKFNVLKKHRVVMVFYIPYSKDVFFDELHYVLEKSLSSLIETINKDTTAITLINNASKPEIEEIVEKYKTNIDKYVQYNENKGKVYAVLNEVRAVNEKFVTITDADILFLNGWETEVFNIFSAHPKAGVVSPYPSPYTSFYYNSIVFGLNTLIGKIQYGKFVEDEDIELYMKGTNLPNLANRNTKFNWKEKQFIIKGEKDAVIGAYHVVSTYRTEQFRNDYSFPSIKFKNSYESGFIDCLAQRHGMYRLSTMKSYTYHIGNKLDDITLNYKKSGKKVSSAIFDKIGDVKMSTINKSINILLGRVMVKYKWNK